MAITRLYDVTCNVCGKEFDPVDGLPVDSMVIVEAAGWLVLYDSGGQNPHAAICPACWDQIVACHEWPEARERRKRCSK